MPDPFRNIKKVKFQFDYHSSITFISLALILISCQLGKRRLLLEQLSKPPPLIPITIKFTDVTDAAGVNYQQHSLKQRSNIQAFMAGGAAAGDYDNDGWVDLYVTRLDDTDLLFRNQGDGTFSNTTLKAFGPKPIIAPTNGAQWGDIDNDGDLDLYVTVINAKSHYLYINDGQGHFTEEGFARGVDLSGDHILFGYSASFGDYDRDGFIDLHVTEWWRQNQNSSLQDYYNIKLLRNQGADKPGYFKDVTDKAGVSMEKVRIKLVDSSKPHAAAAFSSRFSDLDKDGWPDLIIASDYRTSRLFWNNGEGTFRDGTVAAGVGKEENGMGSTVGDVDGDGDLDWFVTSIWAGSLLKEFVTGNRLYQNNGNRTFNDFTELAGVRDSGWGWAATFFDADNDRDLDLVSANGQNYPPIPEYINHRAVPNHTRLWLNDGQGFFTEVSSKVGLKGVRFGKGLLTFDYDNDGDLDLFIVNNGDRPELYRNDGGNNHDWIKLRTIGTLSNREGIGAWIEVTLEANSSPIVHEVDGGNNYLGQNERMVHFGLGPTSTTPIHLIKIKWPSGVTQTLRNVQRNQKLIVNEPSETVLN